MYNRSGEGLRKSNKSIDFLEISWRYIELILVNQIKTLILNCSTNIFISTILFLYFNNTPKRFAFLGHHEGLFHWFLNSSFYIKVKNTAYKSMINR